MRVEVEFARPLDRQTRLRLTTTFATLAKVDRVRFAEGDHLLIIIGEALGTAGLGVVLREEGLAWKAMRTSLPEAEDRAADDATVEGERVVPLGRARAAEPPPRPASDAAGSGSAAG